MSDLSDLQASGSTKVVGSDATGLETNPLGVYASGDLQSADLLNSTVSQGTISVPTGTAVAARVGASNLTLRKLIMIQALTSNMSYGFSSGSQPFTIANGSVFSLALGPNITLFVSKSGGGSGSFSIAEFS